MKRKAFPPGGVASITGQAHKEFPAGTSLATVTEGNHQTIAVQPSDFKPETAMSVASQSVQGPSPKAGAETGLIQLGGRDSLPYFSSLRAWSKRKPDLSGSLSVRIDASPWGIGTGIDSSSRRFSREGERPVLRLKPRDDRPLSSIESPCHAGVFLACQVYRSVPNFSVFSGWPMPLPAQYNFAPRGTSTST